MGPTGTSIVADKKQRVITKFRARVSTHVIRDFNCLGSAAQWIRIRDAETWGHRILEINPQISLITLGIPVVLSSVIAVQGISLPARYSRDRLY